MQFLSIREFNKAPKTALSELARDGKAVLTNNGKPTAIMFTVNPENFEKVFSLVQEVEKSISTTENNKERSQAFERLMKYPRKKLPPGFNYKKELMEAIDERFDRTN